MLFHVQAADISEYEFNLRAEETPENKETKEDDIIPEKFDCYKMLTDAKPNPDVVVAPIGEDCSFTCSCLFSCIFLKP